MWCPVPLRDQLYSRQARSDHEAVARLLVIAGADFSVLSARGISCTKAALDGHEQLVAELSLGGAETNFRDGAWKLSQLKVAACTLLLKGG